MAYGEHSTKARPIPKPGVKPGVLASRPQQETGPEPKRKPGRLTHALAVLTHELADAALATLFGAALGLTVGLAAMPLPQDMSAQIIAMAIGPDWQVWLLPGAAVALAMHVRHRISEIRRK
jgi:hypothetical protein